MYFVEIYNTLFETSIYCARRSIFPRRDSISAYHFIHSLMDKTLLNSSGNYITYIWKFRLQHELMKNRKSFHTPNTVGLGVDYV